MHTHPCGVLQGYPIVDLVVVAPLARYFLNTERPLWLECMEYRLVLTSPGPPVLTYYSNLLVDEFIGPAAVWNAAGLEFVMMTLVQYLHDSEQGVV